jgi:hypothetical protein
MTQVLENIKNTVKQHSLVPFTAREIVCNKQGDRATIDVVANNTRFTVEKPGDIMSAIGIKPSLAKRILSNPTENWSVFQDAISNIDKNKTYGLIARSDNAAISIVDTKLKEIQQLNYDSRIDDLINTLDGNEGFQFHNALFNPLDCSVDINVNNLSRELDMGGGDLWKFGTAVNLSLTNQTYAQYFLRLICTNGMTTRENLAYRSAELTKNIGKQFVKYAGDENTVRLANARVSKLKGARASVYELNSVAGALGKEAEIYFPNYSSVIEDFRNAGYDIKDIGAKQAKLMFTNENLYDVFNVATYLSSHQREAIGDRKALELNKAAGEMFVKGPDLQFSLIDIYKGK